LEYANEIAQRWNAESGSASGYVAQFSLDDAYGARFAPQKVGAAHHVELWVPAAELSLFNNHISPPVMILGAYFGKSFRGYIPDRFGLQGKDATAQFVALGRMYDHSGMDFRSEIAANHLATLTISSSVALRYCPFCGHRLEKLVKKSSEAFEALARRHESLRPAGLPSGSSSQSSTSNSPM
jgi:hypothetical protein